MPDKRTSVHIIGRGIRLVALERGAAGQRDADRGNLSARPRRGYELGAAPEQFAESLDALGAADFPRAGIHQRVGPVAVQAALGYLHGVELFARHRLDRIAPEFGYAHTVVRTPGHSGGEA